MTNPVRSIPDDLNSWKEVASYLGVTVRAAQKWERERGLPVNRAPGKRSVVSASRSDIERWKKGKGRNTRNTTVRRYFVYVTIAHLAMLSIFLSWWFSRG